MVAVGQLTDWNDGDPASASHLQEAWDMLRGLSSVMSSGATEVWRFPNGTAIHTPEPPFVPGIAAKFIITGNETGGGKYIGAILNPPVVNIPATGDLSADELGLGGSTIIRACNVREEGMNTHQLTTGGAYLPVRFTGYFLRVADDGVPVYEFDGRQGEPCTP